MLKQRLQAGRYNSVRRLQVLLFTPDKTQQITYKAVFGKQPLRIEGVPGLKGDAFDPDTSAISAFCSFCGLFSSQIGQQFLATGLFIWLGTKIMTISRRIGARSFEDLNKYLFGEQAGVWISLFMFVILLGVNSIMLAGAGSVFVEHLNMSYQTGLFITMIGTYFILRKGIQSIMTMNSLVVPMMLTLSVAIISQTIQTPGASRFLTLTTYVCVWR